MNRNEQHQLLLSRPIEPAEYDPAHVHVSRHRRGSSGALLRFARLAARRLPRPFAVALSLPLAGCFAAYVVGGAVKAGQKRVDLVLTPGVSVASLASKKNLGIAVNGGNSNSMIQPMAMGSGATNISVYADMLAREFLRLGYATRTVTEQVSEATNSRQIRELADKGFDLVLICNLNFSTTTNLGGAMVGTDYMQTGVTSFTLKGFDPRSGSTLFIASAEYGTAKAAGTVAQDMSALYRDVVTGAVKATNAAASASPSSGARSVEDVRPPTASAAPSPSSPSGPSAKPPLQASARGLVTSVPRSAPVLVSPGIKVAPGPVISSAIVALTWNAVESATGYAVSVKDLTANTVVFSAEVDGDASTMQVPSAKMIAGHAYRWSTRARNAEGYGAYSPHLFFRR